MIYLSSLTYCCGCLLPVLWYNSLLYFICHIRPLCMKNTILILYIIIKCQKHWKMSKFCRSETQRYSMMQHREKKNILTVERLEQLYKYLNDQLSTWQSLTWFMDKSRWRTVTELFKTCCNFSLPTIFISKAENKIYLKSLSLSVLVPLVTTLWPTAGSWPSVWTALIRTGGSCKSRWLLFLFSPLRLPLRAQLFLVWMWSQPTFRWNFSALWFLRWDLHVCIDLDFFSESTCLNRTWVDTIRRPKGTILMNPDTLKYRHADRQTGRFTVSTGSSCVLKQEVIETVWSLSHTQIHKLLLYFLFAVVTLKHNSVLYMVKSDCTDDGDQVQILLWY